MPGQLFWGRITPFHTTSSCALAASQGSPAEHQIYVNLLPKILLCENLRIVLGENQAFTFGAKFLKNQNTSLNYLKKCLFFFFSEFFSFFFFFFNFTQNMSFNLNYFCFTVAKDCSTFVISSLDGLKENTLPLSISILLLFK